MFSSKGTKYIAALISLAPLKNMSMFFPRQACCATSFDFTNFCGFSVHILV